MFWIWENCVSPVTVRSCPGSNLCHCPLAKRRLDLSDWSIPRTDEPGWTPELALPPMVCLNFGHCVEQEGSWGFGLDHSHVQPLLSRSSGWSLWFAEKLREMKQVPLSIPVMWSSTGFSNIFMKPLGEIIHRHGVWYHHLVVQYPESFVHKMGGYISMTIYLVKATKKKLWFQ